MFNGKTVLVAFGLVQLCYANSTLRAPPKVEGKPNLLDSFIPACMQIIAHLTELMKYDLKPTTSPPYGTTTSTIRPTPSHRPAIFAPVTPPGQQAYYSQKDFSYREYLERLQRPSGPNYFDRYRFPFNGEGSNNENQPSRDSHTRRLTEEDHQIPVDYENYFEKNFADVLQLVNRLEPDFVPQNEDDHVQEYLKLYDDSDFRTELLRQKKVPPTKAYVTLLSLYDLLNKDSKRLGLNKYQGYTDRILQELADSSVSSSAFQLRHVLSKIIERDDTKKPDIVKKIKQLVEDLDDDASYINLALRYIPPLAFVL